MKQHLILLTAATLLSPVLAQAGAFATPFKTSVPEAPLLLVQDAPRPLPPIGGAPPSVPSDRILPGTGDKAAEDAPEGLIEQGAKLLLRGIFEQIKPQVETREFSGNLALLAQLSTLLTEIDQFHAPEVLPNGDVLIRRKTASETAPRKAPRPAPSAPPKAAPPGTPEPEIETGPNGEIDL